MVYVELPEVGKEVKKGETFGVVESVKVGKMNTGKHGVCCIAQGHPESAAAGLPACQRWTLQG